MFSSLLFWFAGIMTIIITILDRRTINVNSTIVIGIINRNVTMIDRDTATVIQPMTIGKSKSTRVSANANLF